jgi:hypothetical protein
MVWSAGGTGNKGPGSCCLLHLRCRVIHLRDHWPARAARNVAAMEFSAEVGGGLQGSGEGLLRAAADLATMDGRACYMGQLALLQKAAYDATMVRRRCFL